MGILGPSDFGSWMSRIDKLRKKKKEGIQITASAGKKVEKRHLFMSAVQCCQTPCRLLCNQCCCQAFQKHALQSVEFVCMPWLGELGLKLGSKVQTVVQAQLSSSLF